MRKGGIVISLLVISILIVSMGFVSAGWWGDLWSKVTGEAVATGCTDSDEGIDYYQRGVVQVDGGTQEIDYCEGFEELPFELDYYPSIVNEFYCEGGLIKSQQYDCKGGDNNAPVCTNGACIGEEPYVDLSTYFPFLDLILNEEQNLSIFLTNIGTAIVDANISIYYQESWCYVYDLGSTCDSLILIKTQEAVLDPSEGIELTFKLTPIEKDYTFVVIVEVAGEDLPTKASTNRVAFEEGEDFWGGWEENLFLDSPSVSYDDGCYIIDDLDCETAAYNFNVSTEEIKEIDVILETHNFEFDSSNFDENIKGISAESDYDSIERVEVDGNNLLVLSKEDASNPELKDYLITWYNENKSVSISVDDFNSSLQGTSGITAAVIDGGTESPFDEPILVECTDSDGGINLTEKGVCSDSEGSILNDGCIVGGLHDGWLREASCVGVTGTQEGEFCITDDFNCPGGCLEGRCDLVPGCSIETSLISGDASKTIVIGGVSYQVSISDIDSLGVILYINGVVTDKLGEGDTFTLLDGLRVQPLNNLYTEKPTGISKVEIVLFEKACFKEPIITCTDSDGGINYGVKGQVDSKGELFIDGCTSEQVGGLGELRLEEYYCEEDDVFIDSYLCPNGCVDGACVGGVTQEAIEITEEATDETLEFINNDKINFLLNVTLENNPSNYSGEKTTYKPLWQYSYHSLEHGNIFEITENLSIRYTIVVLEDELDLLEGNITRSVYLDGEKIREVFLEKSDFSCFGEYVEEEAFCDVIFIGELDTDSLGVYSIEIGENQTSFLALGVEEGYYNERLILDNDYLDRYSGFYSEFDGMRRLAIDYDFGDDIRGELEIDLHRNQTGATEEMDNLLVDIKGIAPLNTWNLSGNYIYFIRANESYFNLLAAFWTSNNSIIIYAIVLENELRVFDEKSNEIINEYLEKYPSTLTEEDIVGNVLSYESCEDDTGYDGIDNDGDGQADLNCNSYCDKDGDGYSSKPLCIFHKENDCDDTRIDVNPGANTLCDGIDNNCDGIIDKNCCTDSDGGLDYDDVGTTCIGQTCSTDSCEGNNLTEFSCSGDLGEIVANQSICSYGCSGGACQECSEDWECTDWGECVDEVHARICTDLNDCGTIKDKPNISKGCIVSVSLVEEMIPEAPFSIKGTRVTISRYPNNLNLIETKDNTVSTSLDIFVEDENLYATTSEGDIEVKVLPEEALSSIGELDNINTISLSEKDGELVYSIIGSKESRLFFIVSIDARIKSRVNAGTGEVISLEKPWWRFFALGV